MTDQQEWKWRNWRSKLLVFVINDGCQGSSWIEVKGDSSTCTGYDVYIYMYIIILYIYICICIFIYIYMLEQETIGASKNESVMHKNGGEPMDMGQVPVFCWKCNLLPRYICYMMFISQNIINGFDKTCLLKQCPEKWYDSISEFVLYFGIFPCLSGQIEEHMDMNRYMLIYTYMEPFSVAFTQSLFQFMFARK